MEIKEVVKVAEIDQSQISKGLQMKLSSGYARFDDNIHQSPIYWPENILTDEAFFEDEWPMPLRVELNIILEACEKADCPWFRIVY